MSNDVATKAHVELSPSSSHRWLHCPGSIEAERGLPDTDSIHSKEGTSAHALGELAFTRNRHPETWLGDVIEGITVTQEMVDAVETYVDVLRDYSDGADIVRIERKLTIPRELNPPGPMMGTSDANFVYETAKLLRVVDYKHGKGVVVEAEDNPQLGYYALMAWLDLRAHSKALAESIEEVELVIVQPRAFHPDGPIRTHRMTLRQLKDFGRELIAGAYRAMAPQPPRIAGDHCGFCKAKLTCGEFRGKALSVAQLEFSDVLEGGIVVPDPAALSPDQLGAILTAADVLDAWLKAVRGRAMGDLEAGRPVTGFALKPKRAVRKWADETKVKTWARSAKVKLADIQTTPELKSPAQVEAVAKKVGLTLPEELVVRASSGYTLTTADDPKAVTPSGILEPLELE